MSSESRKHKPKKRGVYSGEDPTKIFEFVEELGKGSYGGVVKARDKRDSSVLAIKIVQIETDNTKELIREISILSKCRSKYIVNYCGSYRHNDEIWITMEYCGAGSVGDVIKITKKPLAEQQIAIIAKHTLSGLKYLHKNNIIHRDVKAGNILLNHHGQCKLADFGVSAQLAQTISRRNTVIGSPYWMAPEVLKQNNYNQKADIWSMGIAIIEMAEGKPPLSGLHPLRALLQIPSNPSPTLSNYTHWSSNMHSFLAMALNKNPDERATAAQLLKHPFIKSAGKKVIIQQLVLSIMPQIEKYREEKRKKHIAQLKQKEKEKNALNSNSSSSKKKKKKKKKKRKIYNAEPVSDDPQYPDTVIINNIPNTSEPQSPPQDAEEEEEDVFDASTMIIVPDIDQQQQQQQNGNKRKNIDINDDDDDDYATMIQRKPRKRNFEEEKKLNVDVRSPEYIISPIFTERSIIYKEFDLEDYIPDSASCNDLKEIRKALWTAYWKDKQIVEDYYIDCRRQIRELLDKMKQQKKKKKRSSNKSGKSSSSASPNKK